MNQQRPGIFSYLAKATVLLLYVCFLIVQVFFSVNLDNTSGTTSPLLSYKETKSTNKTPLIGKTDNAKNKKQAIHLNRRFEPIGLLACNFFLIKPLICNISTESFRLYSNIFIPASFLHSQSFRGPPIVV